MSVAWIILPVALSAFMLPGWHIARRLDAEAPVLTGFFISGALWCNLVLGLNALGVSLERTPLLSAWAMICLIVCIWSWSRTRPVTPESKASWMPEGWDWLWLLPPLIAVASIGIRAVIDPLNGWDNSFRWDGLARSIWYHHSIDFYPPTTAAHFEIYAWCDGIPPLVALLNLWIYLVTDSPDTALIAGRVMGETLLIGATIFMLARRLWGSTGGWPALAAAATGSLLLWGISISQETGLTALSLVALVYFCIRHTEQPAWRTAAAAGLAAGIGALSREYGLAFVLLGVVGFLITPSGRRSLPMYSVVALATAAPWYVRNWILTGNPVFANELGGLFPTNPFYAETMHSIANYWRLGTARHGEGLLLLTILVLSGLTLPGSLIGLLRLRSKVWLPITAILMITGLWLWSLPLTAGGWNYSLRVLTPAVALSAALCGWLGASPRFRIAGLCLSLVLSADAARRSWLLPVSPGVPPIPYTFASWREWHAFAGHITQHPLWAFMAERTKDSVVLVDTPPAHTLITALGGRAAMLFSPAAAPCFDDTLSFEQARVALLAQHVRWLALTITDPIAQAGINKHPFLKRLVEKTAPYARAENIAIYDLTADAIHAMPQP